jgi:hypothetical protein
MLLLHAKKYFWLIVPNTCMYDNPFWMPYLLWPDLPYCKDETCLPASVHLEMESSFSLHECVGTFIVLKKCIIFLCISMTSIYLSYKS